MVKEFILQWHISEVCNLKCKHCYQEDHKCIMLKYDKLMIILEQYKELLKKLKVRGHINLTGGEPLCSPYFFKILEQFKKDSDLYSFSILTNGTLITDEIAKKISEYNPEYVQVSLEGSKKINDYIRGEGVYKKVGIALDYLRKHNIYTSISFTATKINYMEFPKVVKFAKKHKVNNVWSDRFIPLGSAYDKEFVLDENDTKKYIKLMQQEKIKLVKSKSKTNVSMTRALQFLKTNNVAYSCSAGKNLLTVMENGDLVPCRRMPIVVGNLFKDNMYELYKNNKVLIKLRKDDIPHDCKKCEYSNRCKGGLKCLTYAIYEDLDHKDIGCFI